jgi:hypothetical protein
LTLDYNEINFKEGKIILSEGIENFKEIFEEKGNHLYLTTYSYDMPTDYYDWILDSLEYLNDIIVVFNIYNFNNSVFKKIDDLIKRALGKNPYIQFFYNKTNHSKIVSNGKTVYIGSANFTNYTKNNFEAGIILKDKESIAKLEKHVFDYPHLKYETIFSDPISPLIVPMYFIFKEINKEFITIEDLLLSVNKYRFTNESDLPYYGDDLKKFLEQYLQMFLIARKDLCNYAEEVSEEYFIVSNLLDEIESSLFGLIALDPIGTDTIIFFNFIEDYRNSLEEYKNHFWRLNTFNNEITLYKEKIYLSRARTIVNMLQNLRFKWISLMPSQTYIRYQNDLVPILSWLENPILAKKYWEFFIK